MMDGGIRKQSRPSMGCDGAGHEARCYRHLFSEMVGQEPQNGKIIKHGATAGKQYVENR